MQKQWKNGAKRIYKPKQYYRDVHDILQGTIVEFSKLSDRTETVFITGSNKNKFMKRWFADYAIKLPQDDLFYGFDICPATTLFYPLKLHKLIMDRLPDFSKGSLVLSFDVMELAGLIHGVLQRNGVLLTYIKTNVSKLCANNSDSNWMPYYLGMRKFAPINANA